MCCACGNIILCPKCEKVMAYKLTRTSYGILRTAYCSCGYKEEKRFVKEEIPTKMEEEMPITMYS